MAWLCARLMFLACTFLVAANGRKLITTEETVINYVAASVAKYYTNVELEQAIQQFSKRCSSISSTSIIGRSVQGIPLYAIEISSTKGVADAKPSFVYYANIHGDETGGRQILLALAEWLCANYKKNAKATKLVEGIHLYIVPTVNPDGFARRTRENWKGVDMNRDFPDPIKSSSLRLTGREQPEVAAVMAFASKIRPTASVAMHEGALVANYPFDGLVNEFAFPPPVNKTPDDAAFRYLSSKYATMHKTMSKSKEFPGGITNGANWYVIYGGSQDWHYTALGCFEVTLELSDTKYPPASALPTYWSDNMAALINYPLLATLGGIRGVVLNSVTGVGLAATIKVTGIKTSVKARAKLGDFYKPLAPGSYVVTCSLAGYTTQTTTAVVPTSGAGIRLVFKLVAKLKG